MSETRWLSWLASSFMVLTVYASAQTAATSGSPFADKVVDSYSKGQDPVTNAPFVLHWGDLKANDFGPRAVAFDESGLRRLHPAPPPGVHPRILFTSEDLPAMRSRMKESRSGKIMYGHLQAFSAALRGTYDENADYAKPDLWNGNYRGSHGNVQIWYYHDKDSLFNPANHVFARLIAGDMSIDPQTLWPVFALDALRCLIDDDSKSAQELALAVNTAMLHDQKARDALRAAKGVTTPPETPVSGGAGGQDLGFLYDFLYNWLTPQQKTSWHDELAASTWSHDNYGTLNAAVATRSNWATFTYWLMPLLAIEGEPGYNDLKAQGIYRGYRNFLTYGIFPSGAFVEGEAKDQLGGDGLVAMAMRRRPDLFGHPFLQAYVHKFLPQSVLPNPDYKPAQSDFAPGPFLRYDLLGGTGLFNAADAVTMKYMMPNDKVVDWVYRQWVGENYERLPNRGISGYWDDLLIAAIFATDFDPTNADPEKIGISHTYFSGERALMLTRSDWSKNALELGMHTRQLNGGHAYADRNSIFLFGQGRTWFALNQRDGENSHQSEVTIDGKQQSVNSPGRMVDFADGPLATFATGDASYAWNWTLDTLNNNGGYTAAEIRDGQVKIPTGFQPEPHSINDFAFTPMPEPYAKAPLFQLHSWIGQDGRHTPVVRKENYPVKMAYRTAGVVRGDKPYSLILDDIQKDDGVHLYAWQALLEQDLSIVRTTTLPASQGVMDITLAAGGKVEPGEPVLLIRLLNCQCSGAPIVPYVIPVGDARGDKKKPILIIPAEAVSPGFKVLLYSYRAGDPLPATEWNAGRTRLTVSWSGQKDLFTFQPSSTGKTNLRGDRIGGKKEALINLDKPVPALAPGVPLDKVMDIH